MKFYIKERSNPQLKKPYYSACGQLTAKQANKMASPIYGSNRMLAFDNQESYLAKLEELKAAGFNVYAN